MHTLFFLCLAFIVSPGPTACLFPYTSFGSLVGRCGAQGLLARLFVAVPFRPHSALCIVAKWLFRRRVQQAAVLADGVLAGLARCCSVRLVKLPEHMGFFDHMTKVAWPRASCFAYFFLAEPAGPLARVGAAFAIYCNLFVY